MYASAKKRTQGFSVIELLIASGIAILASGLILQTFILTMHTTDQQSAQASTQQRARTGLAMLQSEMRDAWAILTDYTPETASSVRYTTQATANEQTIVAALPSVDADGRPCTWRGNTLIFDCVVWQATLGPDRTWSMIRRTFTNAFQMPAQYFSRYQADPWPGPFRSLLWGAGEPAPTPYTIPTTFLRDQDTNPMYLFRGASRYAVSLFYAGALLAPSATRTSPPAISTSSALPLYLDANGIRTTRSVSVTNVDTLQLSLQYTESATAMNTGSVAQSDVQTVSINLRNRHPW